MGAHQPQKVDHNAAHRKGKGQPAVLRDRLCLRPVRSRGDQIPRRQPDADVGGHAQQHGKPRQGQAQKGQPLVAACITEQSRHIIPFLFFHKNNLLIES